MVGLYDIYKIQKRAELAMQFPFDSMTERLAYENNRRQVGVESGRGQASSKDNSQAVQRDMSKLSSRLSEMENRIDLDYEASFRAFSLRALHEDYVSQFVNAPGFGVGRG